MKEGPCYFWFLETCFFHLAQSLCAAVLKRAVYLDIYMFLADSVTFQVTFTFCIPSAQQLHNIEGSSED